MRGTLAEEVEAHRRIVAREYAGFRSLLAQHVKEFYETHSPAECDKPFPAVDLAAGEGMGTVFLALLTNNDDNEQERMHWYPTDWDGNAGSRGPLDTETRASLQYCIQEAKEGVLFQDKNGESVFKNDKVELYGLQTAIFNGGRGILRGRDKRTPGRFAVQVSPDLSDPHRSFKSENIMLYTRVGDHSSPEELQLRRHKVRGTEQAFYEGLLDRTREVNILQPTTWKNVENLFGKCAFVTCTSLLTCLGYRDPTAWQDTMTLASKLLLNGGYLLQDDQVGVGGFADIKVMMDYVNSNSLGFVLKGEMDNDPRSNGAEIKVLLWQKA